MGLCASVSEEYKQSAEKSKELEKIVKKQWQSEKGKIKLLLLGAGESGKSTIFKQMKIIYGGNFSKDELEQNKPVVHSNVLFNMRQVIKNADKIVPITNQALVKQFSEVPEAEDTLITPEIGVLLKSIWTDPGTQATWKRRSEFQVQDALKYYCENIDRISSANYIPDVQDILRARVRTSGIVEETYIIDNVTFMMYDVGGQRNERKKWIHCFDNVTAVIFVAAISEYDQVLYEDNSMNRMDEAVMLFDEVCNSKYFRKTSMILFLNKKDLFREKLATIPFRVESGDSARYKDFIGPHVVSGSESSKIGTPDYEKCYDAARDYLLQLFLKRNKQVNTEVYHHVTCATDTENVKVVFNACKDIILKSNLRGSGFM